MSLDKEIFKGKTLSDLFGEIYDNSNTTKKQIKSLVGQLKDLVEDAQDATLMVPLIKEYLEIGVKNDEHLIKLATIIQRMESAASNGESSEFDFSELQDLIDEAEKVSKAVDKKKDSQDEGEQ